MMATSQDLVDVSTKLALSKKAEDIVIMDVRELTSVTDFFCNSRIAGVIAGNSLA